MFKRPVCNAISSDLTVSGQDRVKIPKDIFALIKGSLFFFWPEPSFVLRKGTSPHAKAQITVGILLSL